jgi:oligoendopeptidase F
MADLIGMQYIDMIWQRLERSPVGPVEMRLIFEAARAAHEYKAEVERLKEENGSLVADRSELRDMRAYLEGVIVDRNHENTKLKEQLAEHARPATDWRSE